MIQKTEQEIRQAIASQKAICEQKGYIDFAPHDGRCFRCGKNIYQNYTREGRDGKSSITGCPHCNYSFCD